MRYQETPDGGQELSFRGRIIDLEDFQVFKEALGNLKPKLPLTLVLNSGGGYTAYFEDLFSEVLLACQGCHRNPLKIFCSAGA